jgi:hypothetical protein
MGVICSTPSSNQVAPAAARPPQYGGFPEELVRRHLEIYEARHAARLASQAEHEAAAEEAARRKAAAEEAARRKAAAEEAARRKAAAEKARADQAKAVERQRRVAQLVFSQRITTKEAEALLLEREQMQQVDAQRRRTMRAIDAGWARSTYDQVLAHLLSKVKCYANPRKPPHTDVAFYADPNMPPHQSSVLTHRRATFDLIVNAHLVKTDADWQTEVAHKIARSIVATWAPHLLGSKYDCAFCDLMVATYWSTADDWYHPTDRVKRESNRVLRTLGVWGGTVIVFGGNRGKRDRISELFPASNTVTGTCVATGRVVTLTCPNRIYDEVVKNIGFLVNLSDDVCCNQLGWGRVSMILHRILHLGPYEDAILDGYDDL